MMEMMGTMGPPYLGHKRAVGGGALVTLSALHFTQEGHQLQLAFARLVLLRQPEVIYPHGGF